MGSDADVVAAVREGDLEKLQALISADATLANARDENGVSAVLLAHYRRQSEMVKLLTSAKSRLDVFEAAALGRPDELREGLQEDPSLIQAWSPDGFTALHLACFFGSEGAARLLLERGAEVALPSRNSMRVTPLNSAAASGQLAVVKMLLERGAPVNAVQHGGWTALHSAANNGDVEMVKLLLAGGADRTLRSDDGRTARDMALEAGHLDVKQILETV